MSLPAPTALVSPTLSLPPDTPDLVGRDAEVARLRQALENGPVAALGAISGMGGVGKTAVAVRVAHEVAASFPDGVFFADLRGMDARPADPHQVLGDLLRALGVTPAQLPAETAERVALHRSLLADRRVLLVLDNARDLRQVRDLLPTAPGCGLLVTSRTWLTGLGGLGGATLVHLEELPDAVALDLLVRLVGEQRVRAEEAASRALVADCGGSRSPSGSSPPGWPPARRCRSRRPPDGSRTSGAGWRNSAGTAPPWTPPSGWAPRSSPRNSCARSGCSPCPTYRSWAG